MTSPILITYATRSGSTAEVAHALSAVFQDCGLIPDVTPVQQVTSLDGRKTLILGVALYVGGFPKEFRRFLARYRDSIEKLNPWIFVLGPTGNEPKHFEVAREQAKKQLAKYPWLKPKDMRIFGGKFDPSTVVLTFPFSLVKHLPGNPMRKAPTSDVRDWNAIRTWGQSIANALK